MKKSIILSITFCIISIISLLTINNLLITAQAIKTNEYSYTTAVCNSNRECVDFLVECEDEKVISTTKISEMIKMSDEWKDTRSKQNFCKL